MLDLPRNSSEWTEPIFFGTTKPDHEPIPVSPAVYQLVKACRNGKDWELCDVLHALEVNGVDTPYVLDLGPEFPRPLHPLDHEELLRQVHALLQAYDLGKHGNEPCRGPFYCPPYDDAN